MSRPFRVIGVGPAEGEILRSEADGRYGQGLGVLAVGQGVSGSAEGRRNSSGDGGVALSIPRRINAPGRLLTAVRRGCTCSGTPTTGQTGIGQVDCVSGIDLCQAGQSFFSLGASLVRAAVR